MGLTDEMDTGSANGRSCLSPWSLRCFGRSEDRAIVRLGLALAFMAVVLRLFFWWYTRRDWEDSLITVLHSENFVQGLGLTHYRTGQGPLHGFTSPLSVLVPLMGDLVHVGFGLQFIKLVSAFAGGLTVLYALAIAIHPRVRLPWPLAGMVMGYLACEHHQILWGAAGMETQLATLILLMSLYYTISLQPIMLGLSLGLCMLARPDFAFWTVIAGAYVLAVQPRSFLKVTGIALAVYLPWILFTTAYYGSPIPNTIIAKGLGYPLWGKQMDWTWENFSRVVTSRLTGSYTHNAIFEPLGPSFKGHGTRFIPVFQDYGLICDAMVALAVLGTAVIFHRRQKALFPLAAFVLVYTAYYFFCVAAVFGWYIIPFAAMALLLSARGIQSLGALIRAPRARQAFFGIAAAAYVGCFAVILPKTFATEKRIQEDIENQVRKQMGLFLHEVMGQDESVGCEPLGYVAYYSRRTVYDWPGLASRKVVEYSRSHPEGRSLEAMLDNLRPDFIALRYGEYANFHACAWLDADYRVIASFEADPAKLKTIFGVSENVDVGFVVLAKREIAHRAPDLMPGINPAHSRAENAAAKRLARQGKHVEAVVHCRKALSADPDFAEAHNNLGVALDTMARSAEAVPEYEEALRINPDYANAHRNIGIALAKLGRIDEAIQHYLRALADDQDDTRRAVSTAAEALIAQGRVKDAAALYRKYLDADPDYAAGHMDLGKLLVLLRQLDKAVAEYQEALRVDPSNHDAHFSLGVLEETLGNREAAIRDYTTALELDPSDNDAKDRLNRLKNN